MFVRIRLLGTLLCISWAIVAFSNNLLLGGGKTDLDDCGTEEGIVRIGIAGSGKAWFYEWSAAGLKLTEKQNDEFSIVRFAPAGSVYAGRWDEKTAGLAEDFLGADLRLDAPFAVSPDGQLLISGVYPAHGSLVESPSRKVALIDRKKKSLMLSFDAWCEVESLAWAPSGKLFAVLLNQDVTKDVWRGPLDWWAALIGHPISYHTLYVAIYDLQGKSLCEKRINEKLSIGRGYLVWDAAMGETKKSGPPAK